MPKFTALARLRNCGVTSSTGTPKTRSRAKAVNFGIVYGQQAYGLSQTLEDVYKRQYVPLPNCETLYYADIDLYRYFIGREGQSCLLYTSRCV